MAGEPDQFAINSFVDFTSLPRSNAIQWLKTHNNDPNTAAAVWMDGGMAPLPPPSVKISQDAYMEDQFHADRQGNLPNSQIEESFGKQEAGVLGPGAFDGQIHSGAPSRPSSRVSHTGTRPFYGPENNPELPAPESFEEQLQRATANSLNDSQTLPAQESGVSYYQQSFGPATRNDYEEGRWAMTIQEPHTQEIFLNPDPPDRKRAIGLPAFLKPSSSSPSLPPLITILHAIPMAREAFLNRDSIINDYGHLKDWWEGTQIRSLRVINVDNSDHNGLVNELIYEAQRLMAFLDSTERAYGSADAFPSLPTLSSQSEIGNFMANWVAAAKEVSESPPLSTMFSTSGTRCSKEDHNVEHTDTFQAFQIIVDEDITDRGFSLYEAVDETIWSPSIDAYTFLHHLGEVLIFEVHNPKHNIDHLGVSIPAMFCIDRYLEDKVEEAAQMQAEKARISHEAESIEEIRTQLSSYKGSNESKTVDAGHVVFSATQYLTQTLEYRDTSEDPFSAKTENDSRTTAAALEELLLVSKRVTEKLQELENSKNSISERILKASEKYKAPSQDSHSSPTHKYALIGVFFGGHGFYVLESAEAGPFLESRYTSLILGRQWCKVEYDATSSSPVRVSKVNEDEVLLAASTDGPKANLVYASSRALGFEAKPLPPQLQAFVDADNLAFQQELEEFNTENMPGLYDSTLSPHQRKPDTAADDSDLEVEYDGNERRRSMDAFSSGRSSPLDPHPRERFEDEFVPEPAHAPMARLRPLEPKPSVAASSNEWVPGSLQQDTEMQESGQGMLKGFAGKYKIGSYTPEIDMDDDNDDSKGREA